MPGGFVDVDEDLEPAALRELEEETGIQGVSIKQFKTYGTPGRDPRHHTISIVFCGEAKEAIKCVGMDDAADARWFETDNLPELAFDHRVIIEEFVDNYSTKLT